MTGKDLRSRIDLWQEDFPTKYPVKVVLTGKTLPNKAGADCGLVVRKSKKFYEIRIRKQLCNLGRYMALIHEYAHALTYDVSGSPLDHHPEWGLAESRLWSYESDTKPLF